MALQPEPILRAAARWLMLIPGSGVDRVRSILHTSPRFADLTPTQYETALAWINSVGLLEEGSAGSVVERVFARAIVDADWFPDADMFVREPGELPEDALEVAEGLGISEQSAFQSLRRIWGQFDDSQRKLIGSMGEQALVTLLQDVVDGEVDHVAARADGYGFDIAVTGHGITLHLEVKSTIRRGRLVVYLSRNEFETMLRDSAWRLIALRLDGDYVISSIATLPNEVLRSLAPRDVVVSGRWESARFVIPADALQSGISGIRPLMRQSSLSANLPLLVGS